MSEKFQYCVLCYHLVSRSKWTFLSLQLRTWALFLLYHRTSGILIALNTFQFSDILSISVSLETSCRNKIVWKININTKLRFILHFAWMTRFLATGIHFWPVSPVTISMKEGCVAQSADWYTDLCMCGSICVCRVCVSECVCLSPSLRLQGKIKLLLFRSNHTRKNLSPE